MALYVDDAKNLLKLARQKHEINEIKYFGDAQDIQTDFCALFEFADLFGNQLFKKQETADYMQQFGIEYDGNCRMSSLEWISGIKRDEKHWVFVTHLVSYVQAALLALEGSQTAFVCSSSAAIDVKFTSPVLKNKDFYCTDAEINELNLDEFVKAGVDVYYYGNHLNGMTEEQIYDCIQDVVSFRSHISKELDAQVFPKNFAKEWETMKQPAREFAKCFKAHEAERLPNQLLIIDNAGTFEFGSFRKYPLYHVFEYEGKFYFGERLTVKYPDAVEMLLEVSCHLDSCEEDFVNEAAAEITHGATRILTMVLNCNEVCDTTRYWEHVAFVAMYDRSKNTVEICDTNSGIKMFHEWLQQSEDLNSKYGR